jgi:YesN/AraC family two-component response regulator
MRIGTLIVDDEADIRSLLRVIITSADNGLFVAGEAVDGNDALQHLDAVDPTVIVLDQMMPGMSGIQTAMKILERRPRQRIVMCSAYLDMELARRAAAAGIGLCVTKGEIGSVPDAVLALAAAD